MKTLEQTKKAYYKNKIVGDMSKDDLIQMIIDTDENHDKTYSVIVNKLDKYRERFGIIEFDK